MVELLVRSGSWTLSDGRRRGQHEEYGEQDRLVEPREWEARRKEHRARDDDRGDVYASSERQRLCQWTRGTVEIHCSPQSSFSSDHST